nr:unnamed protein product [Callosobruchus chinensis]
MEERAFLR